MEVISNNNTPEQTFTHPRFPVNSPPYLLDPGFSSLCPELRYQPYHLLPVMSSPQMMQADPIFDNPSWIPDPMDVPHFAPNAPLPEPVYRNLNTAHQEISGMAGLSVRPELGPELYQCPIPGCDQYFSRTETTSEKSITFRYLRVAGPTFGFQERKTSTIFWQRLKNKHELTVSLCLTRGTGGWTSRA